jgi:hypothetical protein
MTHAACPLRAVALLLVTPALAAFTLYDAGGFLGYTWNKWGDPAAGTPATVYWSLLPVGTEGSGYCGAACPGTSTLTLPNFYDWDTHAFRPLELDSEEGLAMIRRALRAWGTVAGVTFVYVPDDSGVPINDAAAEPPDTGHIRIGVFDMGCCGSAGAGFAPPPNGFIEGTQQLATGAGDLMLNSSYAYQNPAGAEGDPLESFPEGGGLFLNDLEGLIAHELGHTLGMDHTDVADALMCGWPHACIWQSPDTYAINRRPDADDAAGLATVYGPPVDTDDDDVPDVIDNCTLAANPGQLDADGDLIGNLCDGDLNNSGGTVNFADLSVFRGAFGGADPAADFNGNGIVNFQDLSIFRGLFGQPAGPSGLLD